MVNAPGRNARAVAEFTIGAILAETRLITLGHDSLRAGRVARRSLPRRHSPARSCRELTVGLIGYGHIGTRVVKLLKPFGCRILVGRSLRRRSSDDDRPDGVEQVDLDTLLDRSDVVTLHARVTPETTGFLAAPQFARMKRGSYFINTARGPMVDYEALYAALRSGHLRGAMLETFGSEPVPADSPILRLPNVTLTPHIAGASLRTVKVAAAHGGGRGRRYLRGEPPLNPC